MSYFIEVPLSSGETMLVEVTAQENGLEQVSRSRDVLGRLPEAFGVGLDRAQSFAAEIVTRMRHLADKPDRVAIEFGLKLSAKTGVVIAESTGEAHVKITVEWSSLSTPPPTSDDEDTSEATA